MSLSKMWDKIAKNRHNNNITEALAGTHLEGQPNTDYLKEINDRLEKFITYFVEEFETKLSVYYMVLEGKMKKPGKLAELFSEITGSIIGGASIGLVGILLGVSTVGATFGAKGGQKISGKLGNIIGSENHRKKVIHLIDLVDSFKQDKAEFRRKLVEIGFDIFQSFEMQFMRVTTDQGPRKAMQLLARDATNRAISYCSQNSDADITNGVILGESKIESVKGIPFYSAKIKTPGYKIIYEYDTYKYEWSTASLYKKVGVVRKEREKSCFYQYIDGKSKVHKYGYRRLLTTENWNEINNNYKLFNNMEKNRQFTDYKYVLDPKDKEGETKKNLKKINQNDERLSEDRLIEVIKEVKECILEEISLIKENLTQDTRELRTYLEIIETDIRRFKTEDYLVNLEQIYEEIKVNNKGHTRTHEQIGRLHAKFDELLKNPERKPTKFQEIKYFNFQPPVATFIGRVSELQNLQKQLKIEGKQIVISQIASIIGLGGVGKSELAKKYADENKNYYECILWMNAETEEAIKKSFRSIAMRLNIPVHDFIENNIKKEREITYVVEDLYEYFNKRGRCLLIFDNVEEYRDIGTYLSKVRLYSDNLHVLITSRNQEWDNNEEGTINVMIINPFTPEEAVKFVKDFLKIKDNSQDEDIKQLVELLQYFPLALKQAVAYIQEENKKLSKTGLGKFNVGDYLKLRQQHENKLLDSGLFRNSDRYVKTVFTTWATTLKKIAEIPEYGNQATDILNVMAYLAPDNIPVKMFSNSYKDHKKLADAVDLLSRYSMIHVDESGTTNVHRLVQEVIRINLETRHEYKEVIKRTFLLLQCTFTSIENSNEDLMKDLQLQTFSNRISQLYEFVPHLETFLSRIDDLMSRKFDYKLKIEQSYLESLLKWLNYGYKYVSSYEKHIDVMERLLLIQEKLYGRDDEKVRAFLKDLVEISNWPCHSFNSENIGIGVDALNRAVTIVDKYFSLDSREISDILLKISNNYKRIGYFSEAMQSGKKALAIKERYYGLESLEIFDALQNLGSIYMFLGYFDEAEKTLKRALEIDCNYGGPYYHSKVSIIQVRLAITYLYLKKNREEGLQLLDEVKENLFSKKTRLHTFELEDLIHELDDAYYKYEANKKAKELESHYFFKNFFSCED